MHEFDEYRAEMSFPALAFSERAAKDALSRALGVQGIPTLVILRRDGSVETKDARAKVSVRARGAARGGARQCCGGPAAGARRAAAAPS